MDVDTGRDAESADASFWAIVRSVTLRLCWLMNRFETFEDGGMRVDDFGSGDWESDIE
jgi:hypothetical protein